MNLQVGSATEAPSAIRSSIRGVEPQIHLGAFAAQEFLGLGTRNHARPHKRVLKYP